MSKKEKILIFTATNQLIEYAQSLSGASIYYFNGSPRILTHKDVSKEAQRYAEKSIIISDEPERLKNIEKSINLMVDIIIKAAREDNHKERLELLKMARQEGREEVLELCLGTAHDPWAVKRMREAYEEKYG